MVLLTASASAHDGPLGKWFESLASGKGPCCSFTDGQTVMDVEWKSNNGHYQVLLDAEWINVPDDAVVTAPNLFGRAVVWPVKTGYTRTWIRCFMPGSGT